MSLRKRLHAENERYASILPYSSSIPTFVSNPSTKQNTPAHKSYIFKNGNPWDYFDRKVVLAYTGNRNRIHSLQQELSRIGMRNVKLHWNFNNLYVQKTLFDNIPMHINPKPAILNNAIGHYSIIKTSYELGANSLLVMEDDIRFLRNISMLEKILETSPAIYDFLMLDSLVHDSKKNQYGTCEGIPVSKYWRTIKDTQSITSAACYALSRHGMEIAIKWYELPFSKNKSNAFLEPSDFLFRNEAARRISQINMPKIYFCQPKIARQTRVTDADTTTDYDGWSIAYSETGNDRSNYGQK